MVTASRTSWSGRPPRACSCSRTAAPRCSRDSTALSSSRYTATAREARPSLTGVAGRLERALHNFLETFPLFATAVLLVHVTGRHGSLSIVGAALYLAARIVYVPLYAAAVPLVRSLVWNVAAVGITLVLLALV